MRRSRRACRGCSICATRCRAPPRSRRRSPDFPRGGRCRAGARTISATTKARCCGRTFLAVGKVIEARREAERVVEAVMPFVGRGIPVVGFEPSCILAFRDEIPALLRTDAARRLAEQTFMFEEFLIAEADAGRLDLQFARTERRAL